MLSLNHFFQNNDKMFHSIFNFIYSLIFLLISGMLHIYKQVLIKRSMIEAFKKEKYAICFIVALMIVSSILIGFDVIRNYKNYQGINSISFLILSIATWMVSTILFYNALQLNNNPQISLDPPSRWKSRGSIKIGRVLNKNKQKQDFYLNMDDLAQHMFITGITGTGKSNFMQYFLLDFSSKHGNIPFLLTEFKGEYHHLQRTIKDLLILKPGINFSINIFDPEGSNPRIHAERVYQIFESGGLLEKVEYTPQMERIFVDILNRIIPIEKYRSWKKFDELSIRYLEEDHKRDITIQKSVLAIQNRIRRYYIGTLKHVFDEKKGIKVNDLFKHNVILDLNSIIKLGGEKEDALFFLNMLLKYLWDKNLGDGSKDYNGIRHLTIIEDAQYFAPQELSSCTKRTSYIEDIALLLRGTGECLISLATRPNISKEILANCGVLVAFQLHLQKDLMKELLNLQDWQVKYLSELKKGQCIMRVNSIEKPFVLQAPLIRRSWLTDEELLQNNHKILNTTGNSSLETRENDSLNLLTNTGNKELLKQEIKYSWKRCKYLNKFLIFFRKKINQNNHYCMRSNAHIEDGENYCENYEKWKELSLYFQKTSENERK